MRGGTDSLRPRLQLALTVAAVVLALMVAGTVTALVQLDRKINDVLGVYFVAINQGTTGYLSLVNAETAVRGYALTGNPATLEPFDLLVSGDAAEAAGEPDVDALALLEERFGPDHPALVAVEPASVAAVEWYEDFALPIIEQVDTEGAASVTPDQVEEGRLLFDEVRVGAERYLDTLRAERNRVVAELETWRGVLAAMMVLLVLAAVAVGALLWVFLQRWITTPLTNLAADARRVADGDLDHRVHADGPAEVGQVGGDVEHMRARLASLVAEATAARAEVEASHQMLQDQAEDLRRSNRDLEQFAYVASHDLQEPLRKIASFTQLLAKRYEGQLDERADQYIHFAVDGAKRMQRLINDLLSFSRVGRIGGEVADVDMGAAVDQVRSDLEQAIEETGATVVADDLPVVRGEGPLLVQLLQNVVGNALKFRHPDRAPLVRITAERQGDCWEFACEDNGIGIDPQYADRVFVIFQRLHPKDVYEGTGIGLALCKKIVEYHGGHIWIDPDATEGTRIRWSLPADPDIAPQLPEADAAGTPQTVAAGAGKDG
ncbi:histidine kinase [Actinotalea ferrariae CF5-4]|uniref:histidine kinase n=1 Tax=Actinotalea ferrariae CF5-4 TaxID=948458 RepID=A0A021VSM2_9CELL|nr:ATP-binding protein [Actinotalea ferrariae]EYR64194.1 histidine kinase [Actinotalea ferrariae CF5-4]